MNRHGSNVQLGLPPRKRGTPEAIGDRIRGWGAAANRFFGSGSPQQQAAPQQQAPPAQQPGPQRHPIGLSMEPVPPFLPPQRPTLGPTPVAGGQPEAIPDITEEQVDAAVEAVSDKDGNFSWGDVFMALGRGIGGIAGAMGPAGVGALAGAAMGGGLQGAAMGAVGAMGGKYKGAAEGMELRQKYDLARRKMNNALKDDRVANLKFLYKTQLDGHQYEKAGRTMSQIVALTGVNLPSDENITLHQEMAKQHAKSSLSKDLEMSFEGLFGGAGQDPKSAREGYRNFTARMFSRDESGDNANVRVLAGVPAGRPLTAQHYEEAARAVTNMAKDYSREEALELRKSVYEQYMQDARTEADFLSNFYRRVHTSMEMQGFKSPQVQMAINQFVQSIGNKGNKTMDVQGMKDAFSVAGAKSSVKEQLRWAFASGAIDKYAAMTGKPRMEAVGALVYVLPDKDAKELMAFAEDLASRQVGGLGPVGRSLPLGPEPQPAPAMGATTAIEEVAMTKPSVASEPPDQTDSYVRYWLAAEPDEPPDQTGTARPAPAGLAAGYQKLDSDGLADRFIQNLKGMDPEVVDQVRSTEDMLNHIADADPVIKQAISDEGVRQALLDAFKDSGEPTGNKMRELYKAETGGGWPEGAPRRPGKFGGSLPPSRAARAEVEQKRKTFKADRKVEAGTLEYLDHWRSGQAESFWGTVRGTEKFPEVARRFPEDVGKWPEQTNEMLRAQPEYHEMVRMGVPEDKALTVLKEAMHSQKRWDSVLRDDEEWTESAVQALVNRYKKTGR